MITKGKHHIRVGKNGHGGSLTGCISHISPFDKEELVLYFSGTTGFTKI